MPSLSAACAETPDCMFVLIIEDIKDVAVRFAEDDIGLPSSI